MKLLKPVIGMYRRLFGYARDKAITPQLYHRAVVLDVRDAFEFEDGHLQKSQNVPLYELKARMPELDKNIPVITCCEGGVRSAAAKKYLEGKGYKQVFNGGAWTELLEYEKL